LHGLKQAILIVVIGEFSTFSSAGTDELADKTMNDLVTGAEQKCRPITAVVVLSHFVVPCPCL